jgi:hypothetical protein
MEKALGVYQPVTDDTTSIISYCESSLVLSLVVEMGQLIAGKSTKRFGCLVRSNLLYSLRSNFVRLSVGSKAVSHRGWTMLE